MNSSLVWRPWWDSATERSWVMDQVSRCPNEVRALQISRSWLENSSSSQTALYKSASTFAHPLEVERYWEQSSNRACRRWEICAEQFDKHDGMTWLNLWKGKRGIALVEYLHLGPGVERNRDCILACLGDQFPDALKNWTDRESTTRFFLYHPLREGKQVIYKVAKITWLSKGNPNTNHWKWLPLELN